MAETKKSAQETDHESGINLKGDIALVGFEILEPSELIVVKKIVGNYIRKLSNMAEYQQMRISLRQHQHGKTFKHEVDAHAIFTQGKFEASVTEWNLYAALSSVCEKILQEVEHAMRKSPKGEKLKARK